MSRRPSPNRLTPPDGTFRAVAVGLDRMYTLAYTAFDRAGNGTPCEATVRVPRKSGGPPKPGGQTDA